MERRKGGPYSRKEVDRDCSPVCDGSQLRMIGLTDGRQEIIKIKRDGVGVFGGLQLPMR